MILYGIEESPDKDPICTQIFDFKLVSVSHSVHYLHQTGWLVSLEKHPVYKSIARIYFNWRSPGESLYYSTGLYFI